VIFSRIEESKSHRSKCSINCKHLLDLLPSKQKEIFTVERANALTGFVFASHDDQQPHLRRPEGGCVSTGMYPITAAG
jgi:hypothetical protein